MIIDSRRAIAHKTTNLPIRKVAYKMSRDQRVADNWALLFAQQEAIAHGCPLEVVFTLTPTYPMANMRHYDFMLRGLRDVDQQLAELGIKFTVITNANPAKAFEEYVIKEGISLVVTDFDPLRLKQQWIESISCIPNISHFEVDAHNIVPCHWVSQKVEFAAYTIRPKITRALPEFLTEIPHPVSMGTPIAYPQNNWESILSIINVDQSVQPIKWLIPGEKAALSNLKAFVASKLCGYADKRNNPALDWQSNLSPYLHFGHISAQRIALEVVKQHAPSEDTKAFLEELIVRRELSDNFCYYNPCYDSPTGFPEWARKDLLEHSSDIREYLYPMSILENAKTHDELWNAAQNELVTRGKMHGYMRMYWAKKILEWSASVEEAQRIAIFLNDKYSIDGRDPNGYVGIAWSIGGVHDRPWFPRAIYGKVRYMSYNGCKSKFSISSYVEQVRSFSNPTLF
jgi:deoxyribodipyrimidine photo-lyase